MPMWRVWNSAVEEQSAGKLVCAPGPEWAVEELANQTHVSAPSVRVDGALISVVQHHGYAGDLGPVVTVRMKASVRTEWIGTQIEEGQSV